MANRAALECADQLLRDLTGIDAPFGNKTFLALGDFRQVAPVVKNGGKTEIIEASIRSSPLWKHFALIRLYTPIRNASDPTYAAWVDSIGDGKLEGDNDSEGQSQDRRVALTMIESVGFVEDAVSFLYPHDV